MLMKCPTGKRPLTKAHDRFRWAVCQIDCLQRLKADIQVIRSALADLPKTLDEAYERIFQAIPAEDWPFVRHVLRWVHLHVGLYSESIPAKTLIQSADSSLNSNYLYDEDSIRETCGCLIRVEPGRGFHGEHFVSGATSVVGFAHYTVREFLDSNRIAASPVAYLALPIDHAEIDTIKTVLLGALSLEIDPVNIDEPDTADPIAIDNIMATRAVTTIFAHFGLYCLASALLSIHCWSRVISSRDDLNSLAFGLLDPSGRHYPALERAVYLLDYIDIFPYHDMSGGMYFWEIEWLSEPTEGPWLTKTLVNLLFLAKDTELPEKYIELHSITSFQTQKTLAMRLPGIFFGLDTLMDELNTLRKSPLIVGANLVELFAQLGMLQAAFRLLLDSETGAIDLSSMLLHVMAWHTHDGEVECQFDAATSCVVQLLFPRGADPIARGYRVTPKQNKKHTGVDAGVRLLLEAGAGPDCAGDTRGKRWEDNTCMAPFNLLHNSSPLWICRNATTMKCRTPGLPRSDHKDYIRGCIMQNLLQHGAKSFSDRSAVVRIGWLPD